MLKKKRSVYLDDDLNERITKLAKNNGISKTSFIEKAILYYIKNQGKDYKGLYEILNEMFQHIEEKIDKNTMAINSSKKDTDILLQLKNHELLKEGNGEVTYIDEQQSEEITKLKEYQKKNISKKRTKKLSG